MRGEKDVPLGRCAGGAIRATIDTEMSGPATNEEIHARRPHGTDRRRQPRSCERFERRMGVIRVSIDVSSGASRSRATVWAESIERAMDIARASYPGSEIRVHFPIDPETFLAAETAAGGQVWPELPEEARG
jgi:hypothetical protein